MIRKPSFVLLAILMLLPALSAAKMYRWIDENGQVQYTQTPPPDQQAESIAPPPPPPSSTAAEAARLKQQVEAFDKRRYDEKYEADEAFREAENNKLRDKNCSATRQSLATLQKGGRVSQTDKDGNKNYLDDSARQAKIQEAQKYLNENCK